MIKYPFNSKVIEIANNNTCSFYSHTTRKYPSKDLGINTIYLSNCFQLKEPIKMSTNKVSFNGQDYDILLKYHDKEWLSTEGIFQGAKMIIEDLDKLYNLNKQPNGGLLSAKYGKGLYKGQKSRPVMRDDLKDTWDEVRKRVMLEALRTKFSCQSFNNFFKEIYDKHGIVYFIEHVQTDKQWGDGLDGTGKNMLGKLLTHVMLEQINNVICDPNWDYLEHPNNTVMIY